MTRWTRCPFQDCHRVHRVDRRRSCGVVRGSWHLRIHYNQRPSMPRLVSRRLWPHSSRASAQAADRPNIVFIMTDDHAAHAISAYGSRVNQTPNLDRLAREGALFENVFATNSICTPSRAAILTGQVLAPQRRDGLQPLRQQPHDRRPPPAEGWLPHRHDRQVAPRERSRRLRSLGDPAGAGRLRQPGPLHGHRRDDVYGPVCDRRHHRPRARLHGEAAAQPAVLPDGASQGAAPAVAARRRPRGAVRDAPDSRAGDALGLVRHAHRRAAREPAARRGRPDAARSQAGAAAGDSPAPS